YIGHPLAGDQKYGPKNTIKGKCQFLHAAKLGFDHQTTKERMMFEAPLPSYFEKPLKSLSQEEY
ncbi:RluA family pseudouridine synthase, partial [Listeria monocytogenes]|nr:RluA family pseudouridine synthase [Listeria monocytogenes]